MPGDIAHGFVGKQLVAVLVGFDGPNRRTVDSRADAPGESSRPGHCGMRQGGNSPGKIRAEYGFPSGKLTLCYGKMENHHFFWG